MAQNDSAVAFHYMWLFFLLLSSSPLSRAAQSISKVVFKYKVPCWRGLGKNANFPLHVDEEVGKGRECHDARMAYRGLAAGT